MACPLKIPLYTILTLHLSIRVRQSSRLYLGCESLEFCAQERYEIEFEYLTPEHRCLHGAILATLSPHIAVCRGASFGAYLRKIEKFCIFFYRPNYP